MIMLEKPRESTQCTRIALTYSGSLLQTGVLLAQIDQLLVLTASGRVGRIRQEVENLRLILVPGSLSKQARQNGTVHHRALQSHSRTPSLIQRPPKRQSSLCCYGRGPQCVDHRGHTSEMLKAFILKEIVLCIKVV